MANWTDNSKILFIGTSGLQYKTEVQSNLSLKETAAQVLQFYEKRGAKFMERNAENKLYFSRGSKLIGRLSWLLPLSEKWPYHEIKVSISEVYGYPLISLSYDAWLYLTMIAPPNFFQMEAQELSMEFSNHA